MQPVSLSEAGCIPFRRRPRRPSRWRAASPPAPPAARDADRDAALARAGWDTLRVSAATVRERPRTVVRITAAALRARGYRPA